MAKKVLLTSVCRPRGTKYGDAPSVGYELRHRQVARAQGLLSPLREKLSEYCSRIHLILPKLAAARPEVLLLAGKFHDYRG